MKIVSLTHNGHYWQATVTAPIPPDGVTVHVDRKYGSWQTDTEPRRFVLPDVAAALQEAVRKEKRRVRVRASS